MASIMILKRKKKININMKAITQAHNKKAKIPLQVKASNKTEFALKHKPDLKPKNKRAK